MIRDSELSRLRQSLTSLIIILGALALAFGATLLDNNLTAKALQYCFGEFESGERFAMLIWMAGRFIIFAVMYLSGILFFGIFRVLAARAQDQTLANIGRVAMHCVIPVLIAASIWLILHDFAVTGTPESARNSWTGCGFANVPPWWPQWLPS